MSVEVTDDGEVQAIRGNRFFNLKVQRETDPHRVWNGEEREVPYWQAPWHPPLIPSLRTVHAAEG